MIKVIFKT